VGTGEGVTGIEITGEGVTGIEITGEGVTGIEITGDGVTKRFTIKEYISMKYGFKTESTYWAGLLLDTKITAQNNKKENVIAIYLLGIESFLFCILIEISIITSEHTVTKTIAAER